VNTESTSGLLDLSYICDFFWPDMTLCNHLSAAVDHTAHNLVVLM